MLFKRFKMLIAGAAMLACSLANAEGGNPKFGFQYRAGYTYNDHGIDDYKANADDPSATSSIDLEFVRLWASGEAAKDVNYDLSYNLKTNMLNLAYAKWKQSDMVSLSIGQDKVNQGGYDTKYTTYNTLLGNEYDNQKAFADYSPMVEVHLALAGQLTIQLLNDVQASSTTTTTTTTDPDTGEEKTTTTTIAESGTKNTKAKGPAATIEWQGDFSGWKPLVQIGSYDLNHSHYFALGVDGSVAGLRLILDVVSDMRTYFARDAAGALTGEDATDNMMAYNFTAAYAVGGFTPWLEVHSYKNKQGDNKKIPREDADGNEMRTAGSSADWADNAMSYGIGAACNHFGEGYEPYLMVINETGKFMDSKGGTGTENLSNLQVKVGVAGKF